jgi:hypothetical protein
MRIGAVIGGELKVEGRRAMAKNIEHRTLNIQCGNFNSDGPAWLRSGFAAASAASPFL